MNLTVKTYPLGYLQENTYLLIDEVSGNKAVIDPGYFGELIEKDIEIDDSLQFVILTHGHFDHFNAAEKYLDRYKKVKFIAPYYEQYLMNKDWSSDYMTRGFDYSNCPKADLYVKENDNIYLGENKISFIETPGHTEGGMCILVNNFLFSGDTLFKFSVGNSNLETGNWEELQDSIKNKLYTLDESIIVYPGHGPYTTIGDEKRGNPFV